jgi:hypothetical protein
MPDQPVYLLDADGDDIPTVVITGVVAKTLASPSSSVITSIVECFPTIPEASVPEDAFDVGGEDSRRSSATSESLSYATSSNQGPIF